MRCGPKFTKQGRDGVNLVPRAFSLAREKAWEPSLAGVGSLSSAEVGTYVT